MLSNRLERGYAVLALLLITLIAAGNFVLGFALAVHLGRGPAWAETLIPARTANLFGASHRGDTSAPSGSQH